MVKCVVVNYVQRRFTAQGSRIFTDKTRFTAQGVFTLIRSASTVTSKRFFLYVQLYAYPLGGTRP